jgi:nicotinate-nucleotide pyrophosphorylase (carboxylating)
MHTHTDPMKLPDRDLLKRIVTVALEEDIGQGDITSQLLIPKQQQAVMAFNAREDIVACGAFIPALVFEQLGLEQLGLAVQAEARTGEGESILAGGTLAVAKGSAQLLLAGERVTLNLMQRLCGIATLTQRFVQATGGTRATILDTRKTMPGLRVLDKYAVQAGGGRNHRMGLYDMVLIKDNHIALAGSIAAAVQRARAGTALEVVVECDTLAQVEEALAARPDRILLDNMDTASLREAVRLAAGKVPLEASGGVTLQTVRGIAETGVDFISVGALTHSAPAADIGADITLS